MNKEEFRRKRAAIQGRVDETFKHIEEHRAEETRFINVLHNAEDILNRIDETFEQRTKLDETDWCFLALATGLQLARIYLLPKVKEMINDAKRVEHDDNSIKDYEREQIEKYKRSHEHWESKKSTRGHKSWKEIAFTLKVPYDATKHSGAGFNNRNMHGGYHRVKTLGHDPVLGWIFGTANIITDSITICPEYGEGEKDLPLPYVETYKVEHSVWQESYPTLEMFSDAIDSINEDWHRLAAAIFAQGVHLKSDEYTKKGLPIPFLSLINADKAYEIYSQGVDYLKAQYCMELIERSMKSAKYANQINKLIAMVHTFFYDPEKENDFKLFHVKTRKIVLYSNIIATSSDVIQTSIRTYFGDENAVKDFDFGVFFVTLNRLFSDIDFITRVKREFVYGEWDKIIDSKDNIFKI